MLLSRRRGFCECKSLGDSFYCLREGKVKYGLLASAAGVGSQVEEHKNMMGSFLSRALLMVFGYAYPAYECFKSVENNTPEIDQLLFWCQYWILVALFTVCERAGDAFISWLPMYDEAKLAFIIYLWYPKTKGTSYVFNFLLRPYVSEHETEIDRKLLEVNVKVKGMGLLLWQEAASYGHTKFSDILDYFSSESASQPQAQQQQHNDGSDGAEEELRPKQYQPGPSSEAVDEAGNLPMSTSQVSSKNSQSARHVTCLETKTVAIEPASSLDYENINSKVISKEATSRTPSKWRIFRAASNR